jgi:outer membrane protein with beta-barrel domain
VFALGALAAFSQPVSFGVKGGVPLTDFLSTTSTPPTISLSTTNPYIIGPTLEVRLPANLAVEFDALFRHFRYEIGEGPLIGGFEVSKATSNAWEFPLLLKYKLPGKFVRPYIDGGVAWDHLQGLSAAVTRFPTFGAPTTTQTSNPSELQNRTSTGIVIGGGVEFHALFLHISPEVRFTRWTSQHFGLDILNSNQNQAEFLLGITF